MVALAQHMVSLSPSCSTASRYNFAYSQKETCSYCDLKFEAVLYLVIFKNVSNLMPSPSLPPPLSLSHSVLAAFYTRNFAEKMPDIKPPLLQVIFNVDSILVRFRWSS